MGRPPIRKGSSDAPITATETGFNKRAAATTPKGSDIMGTINFAQKGKTSAQSALGQASISWTLRLML
jgi:hypothetical protein